jgi:tRNA-Thr(GGU) m(6)t(6)A37 methyltransferase TsaA
MSEAPDTLTDSSGQESRLTAQVTLYPAGQTTQSSLTEASLRIFRDHGLEVLPGPMSIGLDGDREAVFRALQGAFEAAARQGETVMVATLSSARPTPGRPGTGICYAAIGHVENEFDEPAPPETLREAVSRIVIDPALAAGLTGLEPGDRVMVLFSFHRTTSYELLQHQRGDTTRPKRGVFALRSPRRPNPIGVTTAELLAVEGNVLQVRGLDAINGTPVLDLKPD